jgi:hypothetical protein
MAFSTREAETKSKKAAQAAYSRKSTLQHRSESINQNALTRRYEEAVCFSRLLRSHDSSITQEKHCLRLLRSAHLVSLNAILAMCHRLGDPHSLLLPPHYWCFVVPTHYHPNQ